jgi:hypothetical protein
MNCVRNQAHTEEKQGSVVLWKCQSAHSLQLPIKELYAGSSSGVIDHSSVSSTSVLWMTHCFISLSLFHQTICSPAEYHVTGSNLMHHGRSHGRNIELEATSIHVIIPGWKDRQCISQFLLLSTPHSILVLTHLIFFSYLLIVMYNLWLRHCFGWLYLLGMHWGLTHWRIGHPTTDISEEHCLPITSLCISRLGWFL